MKNGLTPEIHWRNLSTRGYVFTISKSLSHHCQKFWSSSCIDPSHRTSDECWIVKTTCKRTLFFRAYRWLLTRDRRVTTYLLVATLSISFRSECRIVKSLAMGDYNKYIKLVERGNERCNDQPRTNRSAVDAPTTNRPYGADTSVVHASVAGKIDSPWKMSRATGEAAMYMHAANTMIQIVSTRYICQTISRNGIWRW